MAKANSLSHKLERKSVEVIVDKILKEMDKDRTGELLKLIDMGEKYYGDRFEKKTFDNLRKMVNNPDNRWMKFLNTVMDETDPNVARTTILNLGYEAAIRGTKMIRKNREKYKCNIPWLILFDPTSACNMHCIGCWAGTYGHKFNLSFEDMDKIVTEGKELGVYLYMMTGGEPLVRKKDILKLAQKHNDVEFSIYTNSTLIDEDFCKEVVKCGNIAFQLSIEGSEVTNDERRGAGHYQNVMRAMDLLHKYGILFGASICYTRNNVEAVTDDKFLHMLADKGVRYSFFFHYMPVGNNAVPELMPTPKQRDYMINKIRDLRSDKSDLMLYPMDFQNDGEFVGGCIAGGRNYFHINSEGDAEPCVFIHFSNMNIHDNSILEILHSPLFMAYHKGQPFNKNHLRPCPMLENPEILRKMVKETGAHQTNQESPEDVDHLCDKCEDYAATWKDEAERIWKEEKHKHGGYENYAPENRSKYASNKVSEK